MSEMRENNKRFGLLIALLKGVISAAAVVCLLALVAERLVDRPATAVLAEAVHTPTPRATLMSVAVAPTPSPSSTPEPTRVAPDLVLSSTPGPAPTSTLTPVVHVVEGEETLTVISRRYDVSLEALIALNDLADPDVVYVGQRLTLPRLATASGTPQPQPTHTPIEPTPMPSLASPGEPVDGRWIDVDISEQRLTAYEDEKPVRTTLVSTGLPNTPTPLGQFRIWIMFRYDDMAGAGYYIEDVPYVMYFHEGYGLHGVTWHGNFGHPMSHGCVNLPTPEAEWLFNWADVGTLVDIHE